MLTPLAHNLGINIMAEIVGGLFGVTPESLMAQREAALAQQAQNYAQLSPMQAAQAGFYTAGNRLAGAAGGLMGAQDPEMMRIQQRQSMLQNLDLSNPESLKSGIQQAMQNKDYQLVSELTNRYQASAKAALEGRKTEAEIAAKLGEKLTPEQKNAAGLADAAGLQRGSQEWQDAYSKALSGLTNKNEPTAVVETADGVFLVNKVTGEKISRVGSAPERAAKSNTQIIQQQESEFAKTMGKEQAGMLTKALEQAQTSSQALDRLATMEKTTGNVYSGPQANTAIAASQLLSSLDLLSPTEAKRLSNSEVYAKSAKDLVMKDLGGKLGAGISNADRAYIEERIPQLQNSAPARIELINKLKEIHSLEIKKAKDMQAYAAQKGSLNGFDVTAYGMTKGTPPSASPATGGWSIKVKQ